MKKIYLNKNFIHYKLNKNIFHSKGHEAYFSKIYKKFYVENYYLGSLIDYINKRFKIKYELIKNLEDIHMRK